MLALSAIAFTACSVWLVITAYRRQTVAWKKESEE